jgi:HSP20 family protein
MELQRWNPFKFKRRGDGREQAALARPWAPSPTTWTPQSMLDSMNRLMNQLLSEPLGRDVFEPLGAIERYFGDYSPTRFVPPIDIVDEGKHIKLSCELPGLSKDEVEISVADDTVTIHGEKKLEQTREEEGCYRTERYFGRFSRSIPLPDDVDAEKAEATFHNGVLTLRMPKTKSTERSKRIEIKA